ncbi:glycosyltransferase [Enterococcus faecium]|nr:glycosyl transferase, family 2 [Enterococcus faecium ATCC 8459 = NRRL B-2354]EHU4999214.1 glycosyltransferase [Enterococcus faecium]OTO28143.1 hypothetical protein A5816_000409 [Enterococcus sp. 3G1_DIV0629]EOH67307.1 hypothetical protein UAG_02206 [Enterococcus faecium ATCC 8459 = NRRL B-2354]EOU06437.1 hypothetical protein I581_01032 [Enterococcus faecium ATCC 8459 = NRRL B-2354]
MNLMYSVLMSLYYKENASFLKTSILSIINQTVMPSEIVIVIDGPITDELEDCLQYFLKRYDTLFKIVRLPHNVGLGLALNEGLKVCSNELVARMDTDDISLVDRCEKQLNEFNKNPKLVMVGTNVDEFYDTPDNITSTRKVPSDYEGIKKFIKTRSPFNHPTVMYKKSEVLKLGGYKDIKRKEDYELFMRMVVNKMYTLNIPESLLLFRSNYSAYKRRTSLENCMSYIKVSHGFFKKRYIKVYDFIYVTITQIAMFILPFKIVDYLTKKKLRR